MASQVKTSGIMLGAIKYSDNSLICHIYTLELGSRSYLVNQPSSSKKQSKSAFFQPLTLLDLVVYDKPQANLNRIREMNCLLPYRTIPFSIKKTTINLFLAEILHHLLRKEDENPALFHFLVESMAAFDQLEYGFESFHIQLLLKMTAYLGYAASSESDFFEPIMYRIGNTSTEDKSIARQLLINSYSDSPVLTLDQRQRFLDWLLLFYREVTGQAIQVKSLHVLRDVYS